MNETLPFFKNKTCSLHRFVIFTRGKYDKPVSLGTGTHLFALCILIPLIGSVFFLNIFLKLKFFIFIFHSSVDRSSGDVTELKFYGHPVRSKRALCSQSRAADLSLKNIIFHID